MSTPGAMPQSDIAAQPDAAAPPQPVGKSSGIDSATGWLVVFATMLSTFAVFGVAYSFGAFFTTIREEFGVSNSEVALLFSLTTFLYFILGVVTGRLADRFGPRPVLLVGAVIMVAALLITSRVTEIWIGYITYGVGVGIGVACAYVPMVAVVGAWFNKHRTTAIGVAVAGIGLGTLVGAPVAKALTDNYGWRTGYVVMAIVVGGLLLIASIGAKRPPPPENPEPLPQLRKLIFNARFAVLYLAILLLSAALFVPFVYLDDYLDGYGSERGALLIGLLGAASIIGRLGFGAFGAKTSLMRLSQFSFAILGGSFLLWRFADGDFTQLLIFVAVFGIAYGGFIALSPAVAAQMFGALGLGGVLGALYTSAGFGGLIGPPLAGELIDRQGYNITIEVAMWTALSTVPILVLAEILTRRHARKRGADGNAGADAGAVASGAIPAQQSAAAPQQHITPQQPATLQQRVGDFDSVLLLSFGGPEGPDDVMPFLRNVTAERDVPERRLQVVAQQYLRHDGISPIGRHNRELSAALGQHLHERGFNVPIYLANRNWHPLLPDVLGDMASNGHERTVCVLTSAFSSYSSCRQYGENIAAARAGVNRAGLASAPTVTRVRMFHNHPGFVDAVVERVQEARRGANLDPGAPTIFTAHSLPATMAAQCDYELQLRDTAAAVVERAGLNGSFEVAFQSRSGRASTPWLEPDIGERLVELAKAGNTGVLVVPLGFMSDHMEVLHDLDTVARAAAARHHLTMVRAKSVGSHPLLVAALADLIEETAGLRSDRPAVGLLGPSPDQCFLGCCAEGSTGAANSSSASGAANATSSTSAVSVGNPERA